MAARGRGGCGGDALAAARRVDVGHGDPAVGARRRCWDASRERCVSKWAPLCLHSLSASDAPARATHLYAPQTMSHALLLRLFLSPSFFSVHVALQYLRIYADNIGVTYYLTRRLRELDTRELREVWGFVW